MRLTAGILGIATGMLLAGTALAEERTLVGKVKGDRNSVVKIVVQRLGGEPFRINEFKLKKVDYTCFGSTPNGELTDEVKGRMSIAKRTNPFDFRRRTHVYNSKDRQATVKEKAGVFILGIVDAKAKRTSGNLGFSFGDGCGAGGSNGFVEFTASR